MKPAHRRGSYTRRAAAVRAAANANPNTRCMSANCKHEHGTLADHPAGSTWDAGHARSGDPTSPLQPEVSGCNRSAGATEGNRRRVALITSRNW